MSKLKVDEIRSADRSVSSTANITLADDGKVNFAENLVIANGKGIDFSAAADTGTGETVSSSVLDDYEEGTWTPTLHQAASATNDISGCTVQRASYRKIGTLVHLELILTDFHYGSFNSNGSAIVIGGIPFTSATNNNSWVGAGSGSTWKGHYNCTAMLNNYAHDKINLAHSSGTTNAYVIFSDLFTGLSNSNGTRFSFGVTYQTT